MGARMSNQIVLENQKPGTPIEQTGLMDPQSTNIEGYASNISVNVGDAVDLCVNTDSTNYSINIYRLGYYNGDGCRLVDTIQHQSATANNQPKALTDPGTGLVDASNWHVTDVWNMPSDATSGVYVAQLVREDGTAGTNEIPFIVRQDGSTSDIVFQTSDETWQAYNPWGGESLYQGTTAGAPGFAKAVSYDRPINLNTAEPNGLYGPWDFVWGEEYPAIRFLEKNGYDVSYITGLDTSRDGAQLLNHKVFLSVGHDEYWTAEQVANVTAARDAGVNLEFWGGNEIFWKTRFDVAMDGTPLKTLVSYKESYPGSTPDPSGVWTGSVGRSCRRGPGQRRAFERTFRYHVPGQ